MSSTEPREQTVRAELVVDPIPDIDPPRYALSWDIAIGGGEAAAGRAGTATFSPEGSNLHASFDYEDAGQMLSLSVPFGFAEDSEVSEGRIEDLIRQGTFSHVDAALVKLLLTEEIRDQLESATESEVSCAVEDRPGWRAAGRIALAQTHLRTVTQPLDGIWAAEVASLVWQLRAHQVLSDWVTRLVLAAAPALRLLDPTWLDRDPPDQVRSRLHYVLLVCARLSEHAALGELASRIFAAAATDALLHFEMAVEAAARQLDGQREPLVAVGDDLMSPTDDAPAAPHGPGPHHTLLDYSATELVADARWEVVDGRLRVRAALLPRNWPAGLPRRLMVRATTADGDLVAAGLSMGTLDDATLEITLALPPEIEPATLVVVVGRHLPLQPFTERVFRRRQATYYGRLSVDARRIDRYDPFAGPAAAAWRLAGRPDLAEVTAVPVQQRFLVEQLLGASVVNIGNSTSDDAGTFMGARSLAWSLSTIAYAASFELRRIEAGGDPDELAPEETDSLILEATLSDDSGVARSLDESAIASFSRLFR